MTQKNILINTIILLLIVCGMQTARAYGADKTTRSVSEHSIKMDADKILVAEYLQRRPTSVRLYFNNIQAFEEASQIFQDQTAQDVLDFAYEQAVLIDYTWTREVKRKKTTITYRDGCYYAQDREIYVKRPDRKINAGDSLLLKDFTRGKTWHDIHLDGFTDQNQENIHFDYIQNTKRDAVKTFDMDQSKRRSEEKEMQDILLPLKTKFGKYIHFAAKPVTKDQIYLSVIDDFNHPPFAQP